MYCSNCGKEVDDNAVVCIECGSLIKKEEVKNLTTTTEKRNINILCIVGFVVSILSWFITLFGIVAIAGLVLSILGTVQAKRNYERLIGLGIAGIIISSACLIYVFYWLVILGILFNA